MSELASIEQWCANRIGEVGGERADGIKEVIAEIRRRRYQASRRAGRPATSLATRALPEACATALRQLREGAIGDGRHSDTDTQLVSYMRVMRSQRWPLQAIADPLGIGREAVRQRIESSTASSELWTHLPEVPPCPPRRKERTRSTPKVRMKPTSEESEKLQRLQACARKANGVTPIDDPRRNASLELSRLMAELAKRGISYVDIAKATGVASSTVHFRLARHGYKPLPPSQAHAAYKGHRSWDTAEDGATS
jgi:hypothetical protein